MVKETQATSAGEFATRLFETTALQRHTAWADQRENQHLSNDPTDPHWKTSNGNKLFQEQKKLLEYEPYKFTLKS